jgi:sulfur transfer protein SufE
MEQEAQRPLATDQVDPKSPTITETAVLLLESLSVKFPWEHRLRLLLVQVEQLQPPKETPEEHHSSLMMVQV